MSSETQNERAPRLRLWWLVAIALAILVVVLMVRSRKVEKPVTIPTPLPSQTSAPPKSVSVAPTVAKPVAPVNVNATTPAGQHVERVFDSNRVSGRLLYSKGRDNKFVPDSDAPSGWDLWIKDASGNERLANASVYSAKFSPDGQRIAYSTSDVTLRVEDLQGNKLAEVEGGYSPQWKSDGSAVAFAKVPEGRDVHLPGTLHLAVLDPANGQVNILTDGHFDDGRPEFVPSGERILFVSGGRTGLASFWEIDPHGGEPIQITNVGERSVNENFVPTPYQKTLWSADGRWFLYDFKSGDREQIWGLQFGPDGKLARASQFAEGLDPTWSQDGRTFTYTKRVNGQLESAVGTLP